VKIAEIGVSGWGLGFRERAGGRNDRARYKVTAPISMSGSRIAGSWKRDGVRGRLHGSLTYWTTRVHHKKKTGRIFTCWGGETGGASATPEGEDGGQSMQSGTAGLVNKDGGILKHVSMGQEGENEITRKLSSLDASCCLQDGAKAGWIRCKKTHIVKGQGDGAGKRKRGAGS